MSHSECPVAEGWSVDLPGLPLDGLTDGRARIIRETLNGYPVRFWSVNDETYDRSADGTLGVFVTIRLRGDWVWGAAVACVGDIVISTDWGESRYGPACGNGVQRVLGPGALRRLDVIGPDPWDVCVSCNCWRPRAALYDADRWMRDDRYLAAEYSPRLFCRDHRNDD